MGIRSTPFYILQCTVPVSDVTSQRSRRGLYKSSSTISLIGQTTTMIVEPHWRKIKHDFLHRFNRPRIDLVLWVLTSRVVPSAFGRLKAIMARDYRQATCSWRKAFKKQWKELSNRVPEGDSFQQYHTNPQKWVCGCDFFSRKPLSHMQAPYPLL